MKRFSNHARVEHILHRNRLPVHGKWIETGVPSRDNSYFGQLFRGCAILVHVSTRRHSVCSHQRVAIGSFVSSFGDRRGPSASANHPSSARKLIAGIGDQRYFTLARVDCRYRVIEVRLKRGATN